MLVWHYTVFDRLVSIEAAGEIVPATVAVAARERPAVWFSRRSTWEPTATKGVIERGVNRNMTIPEMVESGGGPLVRIGIESSGLMGWTFHVAKSGIKRRTARLLERVACEVGGDPSDWLVHYGPVERARWLSIEVSFDGERWGARQP
jgi:hypothetical protein